MEVVVGRVGRAHGIRGEVGVEVRTDEPERRFVVGATLLTDPGSRPLTVRSSRAHQQRRLVAFEQVSDRAAAEALHGLLLVVTVPDDERPRDPEEFYDRQLVGLEVRPLPEAGGDPGDALGRVREVLHLPVQDVLACELEDGREVLVPFVAELVPAVDVSGGWVGVADVPGLLRPDEDAGQ
ncbi:MAG: ribosome maturation factor RimM [Actinomycetota bacterium]|nr:ribosome maturation factor RimM [Actinomycetota bacterium]